MDASAPPPRATPAEHAAMDWRNLAAGLPIPSSGYCDQPYIVKTEDGAWLCCLTTGPGEEGARGQHVATMRSTDRGRTWSAPVAVEPGESRENSYAVMLKGAGNRVFIFYNFNRDDLREICSHDRTKTFQRVDSLGAFVFKTSDDGGRTWSSGRHAIPVRAFRCDLENVYGGDVRFFWNVGRPFVKDGAAHVPLIKVGRMGRGFFEQSEGVLLRSPDLLAADDPAAAAWETLPDGDVGLRAPAGGGPISEEQSYSLLSDGSLYATWRTLAGRPAEAYSRDGGRTWSPARWRRYADGREMKHPRAAAFAWRRSNGRFLSWFHNHGGPLQLEHRDNADGFAYQGRNPVWVCVGREIPAPDGLEIAWSQPEILLYDVDPTERISYPDLVEDDGRTYVTETQKTLARLHEIPADFLRAMDDALDLSLGLADAPGAALEALLAQPPLLAGGAGPASHPLPRIDGTGLSLEIRIDPARIDPGALLLGNLDEAGNGFAARISPEGDRAVIAFQDEGGPFAWASDPIPRNGAPFFLVANLDPGPRIASFLTNGLFCDGAADREYGWARFRTARPEWNGAPELHVGASVLSFRLRDRPLLSAEALFQPWNDSSSPHP
jgi:hypothetical protein